VTERVLVTDVTVGDRAGRAVLVEDGRIAWLGDAAAAPSAAGVVAGEGALLTPAFVDAHVHATATGLALTGLDLHSSLSLADAVASLRAHAGATPGGVLLGTGWDETGWPEGRGLTRADVDAVVGDRPAYLARVDVHSATASTALLDRIPGIADLPGFSADGQLRLDAHHAARQEAYGAVDAVQRGAAAGHPRGGGRPGHRQPARDGRPGGLRRRRPGGSAGDRRRRARSAGVRLLG
jgi:predicted amidohydrolase YtcJ